MADFIFTTQMSEPKNKTNYFDGTMKRVCTGVVDSSSDDESIAYNVKKSKVISLKAWPRFFIIGSADDQAFCDPKRAPRLSRGTQDCESL